MPHWCILAPSVHIYLGWLEGRKLLQVPHTNDLYGECIEIGETSRAMTPWKVREAIGAIGALPRKHDPVS